VRSEGGTTSHSACSVRMPVALGNDPLAGALDCAEQRGENSSQDLVPSCRSGVESVTTSDWAESFYPIAERLVDRHPTSNRRHPPPKICSYKFFFRE